MMPQFISDISKCAINKSSPLDVVCMIKFAVDNFKNKYNTLTRQMESDMKTINSILNDMDEEDQENIRIKLFDELKKMGISKGGLTELIIWDRYGVSYDKRYKHRRHDGR